VFVLAVLGVERFLQESAKQIKKINQVWVGYYNSVIINEKWSVIMISNSGLKIGWSIHLKH